MTKTIVENDIQKKSKPKRYRSYAAQRSYEYDSQLTGETKDEWKSRIKAEWTLENLSAISIILIFHDNDVDENGVPKGLHVHAVINFKESQTQSNAVRLTKCSNERNCEGVHDKVGAYRYLLHATDNALNAKKHVYDADKAICLPDTFSLRDAMSSSSERKTETLKKMPLLYCCKRLPKASCYQTK